MPAGHEKTPPALWRLLATFTDMLLMPTTITIYSSDFEMESRIPDRHVVKQYAIFVTFV